MEPYIIVNTNFRTKAKSDFEKDFYKFMNNSAFRKTMENLRNRIYVKLGRPHETTNLRKLIASPLFESQTIFTNSLVGVHMRKSRLFLNKPVYTGMTILENSKILMYDFFYNNLKKSHGQKCELLYTDTDSLLLEIETEDVYKDMASQADLFDTSDYLKDHFLFSEENKKVLGKMKDECAGKPISECVCLRPKMYSILRADDKNTKKGVKKNDVKDIRQEVYKETLFGGKEMTHEMSILRSANHEIFGMHIRKTSLSPFDSKRWIEEDGINTKAFGFNPPPTEAEGKELMDWLDEIFGG